MNRRAILALAAACSLAVAFPLRGTAKDKDKDDANVVVQHDAVVQFGQGQPQTGAGSPTHFLDPDDVTISKGGTVTFVVNGGGHGVSIFPVARKTTRDDIWPDLCNGPHDTVEADRTARAATDCNAATGTANKAYQLTDAKGDIVVEVPANVNNSDPRVDDQDRILLSTIGRIPGDTTSNKAGAFLVGTAPAVPPATGFTVGNRIQYRFLKTGRYLIICQNRGHSMNDHMFGFVNVVGDEGDD